MESDRTLQRADHGFKSATEGEEMQEYASRRHGEKFCATTQRDSYDGNTEVLLLRILLDVPH